MIPNSITVTYDPKVIKEVLNDFLKSINNGDIWFDEGIVDEEDLYLEEEEI